MKNLKRLSYDKQSACPKCGRFFTTKGNMTRHYQFECGQPPMFKCPHCEFRSKQTSNVMSHIRNKHPDVHAMESYESFVRNNIGINERIKQSQKLLHYCPKCLRSFTLKSNRNRHVRYECGYEPRFKCPYCELRSKQTSHIYCHIRKKHPTEKVFVVDLIS